MCVFIYIYYSVDNNKKMIIKYFLHERGCYTNLIFFFYFEARYTSLVETSFDN